MKRFLVGVSCVVGLVAVFAACGGTSGEDACANVNKVCSSSSTTTGDAGAAGGDAGVKSTTTVTSTCNAAALDEQSSDYRKCLAEASTCAATLACKP